MLSQKKTVNNSHDHKICMHAVYSVEVVKERERERERERDS